MVNAKDQATYVMKTKQSKAGGVGPVPASFFGGINLESSVDLEHKGG